MCEILDQNVSGQTHPSGRGISGCGRWKLGGKIMRKVEIRGNKMWKCKLRIEVESGNCG